MFESIKPYTRYVIEHATCLHLHIRCLLTAFPTHLYWRITASWNINY